MTFFDKMLSSVPRVLNPEEALFLLRAVREIVLTQSTVSAPGGPPHCRIGAIRRIFHADFPARSPRSIGLPAGMSGPAIFVNPSCCLRWHICMCWRRTHIRNLPFSPEWQRLLSAVTWETILKSTQPASNRLVEARLETGAESGRNRAWRARALPPRIGLATRCPGTGKRV